MKSRLVETWGVFLGFARPFNRGWIIQPAGGIPTFDWCYDGFESAFERARQEQGLR